MCIFDINYSFFFWGGQHICGYHLTLCRKHTQTHVWVCMCIKCCLGHSSVRKFLGMFSIRRSSSCQGTGQWEPAEGERRVPTTRWLLSQHSLRFGNRCQPSIYMYSYVRYWLDWAPFFVIVDESLRTHHVTEYVYNCSKMTDACVHCVRLFLPCNSICRESVTCTLGPEWITTSGHSGCLGLVPVK